MSSDRDIQRAIEAGQRNLETKELIHNWCGHARVEKFGGTGLIEMETGLPIGHLSMVCDHVPARGFASWFLEESAITFYDNNCIGCTKRQPIRLPNLTKLIERRDREAELSRIRSEEERRLKQAAFDSRCSTRAELRSKSSVEVVTFIDDLQTYDAERSQTAAHRLIESARLAPEILTPDITEHLFSLIDNGERWFDEVGLTILRGARLNAARLAHCAMLCLSEGRSLHQAAAIVADEISNVVAKDVRRAVPGLAWVASRPRSFDALRDPVQENPLPLSQIFEHFPAEASQGIEDLLSDRHPFRVRMGAHAVISLSQDHPSLPVHLCRSLSTRLARADTLIDIERESEQREVVHDLTQALICAFMSDPTYTDTVLMRYFEGATAEGESRLSGVYERIISRASGHYRDGEEEVSRLDPYRVALQRLVSFADTSDNENVIRDIVGALRSDPGRLAPLANELMDTLLGAAVLADSKLAAFSEPSPLIAPKSFLDSLEQDNRRRDLWSLRASFVRWSIHGAVSDLSKLTLFTDFLGKSDSLSEELHASIIEELPPLMETGDGLCAVLPFFYSAMVGKSNLVRAATAKAIREIGARRFNELPWLVMEAFLLMLSDPYVIVHKSAVRALEHIDLPDQIKPQAMASLAQLIVVYRGEKDQEAFLLTCMEVYASGKCDDEQFTATTGRVFIAMLNEVKPTLLINQHRWLLKHLAKVEGYAELVLSLFEHCDSEYDFEHVLDLVGEIPNGTMGRHIVAIKKVVANDPLNPMVIGAFLEGLTRDGEWCAALDIGGVY